MMYQNALLGGVLIGLASSTLLIALGRVAGISGIIANALVLGADRGWRIAFLLGLISAGAVMMSFKGVPEPAVASLPTVLLAGALVGVGTVLGSGCTSGHGVCGLARCSKRSLVSVLVFMGVGMLTVSVMGGL